MLLLLPGMRRAVAAYRAEAALGHHAQNIRVRSAIEHALQLQLGALQLGLRLLVKNAVCVCRAASCCVAKQRRKVHCASAIRSQTCLGRLQGGVLRGVPAVQRWTKRGPSPDGRGGPERPQHHACWTSHAAVRARGCLHDIYRSQWS